MITKITAKELEENGFYWRIIKRRGKVVKIEVGNTERLYREHLEWI